MIRQLRSIVSSSIRQQQQQHLRNFGSMEKRGSRRNPTPYLTQHLNHNQKKKHAEANTAGFRFLTGVATLAGVGSACAMGSC
mmetsp:Transcript_8704/g.12589  ORF Transcript_8704/g.12589 Transcript_8704/m.12589 type:complete len:82 (+) Transcript_8704:244-489(+)